MHELSMTKNMTKNYPSNHHLVHLVVGMIFVCWPSVSPFCSDGVDEEFPLKCIVFVHSRSSLAV